MLLPAWLLLFFHWQANAVRKSVQLSDNFFFTWNYPDVMPVSETVKNLPLALGLKWQPFIFFSIYSISKANSAKTKTLSHCLLLQLKGLNCIPSLAFLLMSQLPSYLGFLYIFFIRLYTILLRCLSSRWLYFCSW